MRNLLFTLIGLSMMTSAMAQVPDVKEIAKEAETSGTKMLSMEDAILGYNLYPWTKYVVWKGNENVITYLDNNVLMSKDIKTKKTSVLLTLDDLNSILGLSLRGWTMFKWEDASTLSLSPSGKYIEIDVANKTIKRSIDMGSVKGAENITFNNGCVAYTKQNNLYYKGLDGKEIAITSDKNKNIVNGNVVSRNEFGIKGGIFWSPNGKKIAFYKKDESKVTNFPLLDINSRTGSLKEIKYPMNGMDSEIVSLGIYDVETGKTVFADVTDFTAERYITNVTWGPSSDVVYAQILARSQKEMHLNSYDASTGNFIKTLLTEEDKRYVEPQTPIVFLKNDPTKFLYSTDVRDGFYNLYVYDLKKSSIKRLTNVDADVEFLDEDGKYLYYYSYEVSPIELHLYKMPLKGGKAVRLTGESGTHNVMLSGDKSMFIDTYTAVNVPKVVDIKSTNGTLVENFDKSLNRESQYKYGEITIGSIKSAGGNFYNNYRLIKPINFDASKKYPVIVYVYGGPHNQCVDNTWHGGMRRWEMLMAQKGYVVFCMDNRGTPHHGAAFEKSIYGQCGVNEMADQMEGIKYLKSFSWVDADRIGLHGWSYGGFMTINMTIHHPEVFKVAVAGGPVIDWKWYEIMYGERYMGNYVETPNKFEAVSLINQAKNLKSKLLICQGAVDNVVVWQQSLSFIRECIKNLVQVDYFPYPCAEHNVLGKDRIHLMQKVTNYFDDYLK